MLGRYHAKFATDEFDTIAVPELNDLSLREPRVVPPASLAGFCTTDRYDRAAHTYGKSYPDYVRAMLGDYNCAPDVVAYPRNEEEISAVMEWASSVGASMTPFGGGSSVCGGVEPHVDGIKHKAAVTLDLPTLQSRRSRSGIARRIDRSRHLWPSLENQLKPHGFTLRHFPQSFEYSTLGGWIATRSGGHFASLHTHIDDFVESLRVVARELACWRRADFPDRVGPSPDRMFIGSGKESAAISRAWMRLQPRPGFRAGASIRFPSFFDAARAVRAVAQAGLYPSNCRILDPREAFNTGAADGSFAIMVLAFESAWAIIRGRWMTRALECCADHRGTPEPAKASDAHLQGAAGIWRNAFIRMPYAREIRTPAGLINDTFETAITWDRFESFHDKVKAATERAILEATGVKGEVTCRFTHVYPDGPAPYFSFHALGRHGALLEQWQAIKNAASDALIEAGGTITHHHAVGRDHRSWYDRQRPAFRRRTTRSQARTRSARLAQPRRPD